MRSLSVIAAISIIATTAACSGSSFDVAGPGSEDSGQSDAVEAGPDSGDLQDTGAQDTGADSGDLQDTGAQDTGADTAESSADADAPCVPTSKSAACSDRECGPAPDGCGSVWDCGGCVAPETCGGGAESGKCGCTPYAKSTACAGKDCGDVPDGCGGTINCGTSCPYPYVCGALSPNQCGCKVKTQAEACGTYNCSSMPDGCGGMVSCGVCPDGQSCGYKAPKTCSKCDPYPAFTNCPLSYPFPRTCGAGYLNSECISMGSGVFCCTTTP